MITISSLEAIIAIATGVLTAGGWVLGRQAKKTNWENFVKAGFKKSEEKDVQQDEHMEFMDQAFAEFKEEVGGKLDKILDFMSNSKVTREQVIQLRRENRERLQENKLMAGKIDQMFTIVSSLKR